MVTLNTILSFQNKQKIWTKQYTHIRSRYLDKFEQKKLKVKAEMQHFSFHH